MLVCIAVSCSFQEIPKEKIQIQDKASQYAKRNGRKYSTEALSACGL